MLYAVALHWVAGTVAGSLFRVGTLFLIVNIALVESAILATRQFEIATIWSLTSIASAQAGYLAGIYLRAILEQAGYLLPPADARARRN